MRATPSERNEEEWEFAKAARLESFARKRAPNALKDRRVLQDLRENDKADHAAAQVNDFESAKDEKSSRRHES